MKEPCLSLVSNSDCGPGLSEETQLLFRHPSFMNSKKTSMSLEITCVKVGMRTEGQTDDHKMYPPVHIRGK